MDKKETLIELFEKLLYRKPVASELDHHLKDPVPWEEKVKQLENCQEHKHALIYWTWLRYLSRSPSQSEYNYHASAWKGANQKITEVLNCRERKRRDVVWLFRDILGRDLINDSELDRHINSYVSFEEKKKELELCAELEPTMIKTFRAETGNLPTPAEWQSVANTFRSNRQLRRHLRQSVKKEKLIVACLTFNRLDYTRRCLESLAQQSPWPVWIFDDGSNELGMIDYLKKIVSEREGWALFTFNHAFFPIHLVRLANTIDGHSDFICQVDNDFIFSSKWADMISKAMHILERQQGMMSLVNTRWRHFHYPVDATEIDGEKYELVNEVKSGSLVVSNTLFCDAIYDHVTFSRTSAWDHSICDYFKLQKLPVFRTMKSYAYHFGMVGCSNGELAHSLQYVP